MTSKSLIIRVMVSIAGSTLVFLGIALAQSSKQELTFSRDIAPLLKTNCSACHRPNDMAPFSVLTYRDLQPWIPLIKEQVKTRQMPPWHADPRFGDFANSSRLAQKDVDTIVSWVNQGAKEGEPKG